MTSELTQAQELFDALCDLGEAERSRRLRELEKENESLAALVAGLLESHDVIQDATLASAADLLEPAVAEQLELASGTRVGNWKVDEKIGMGGMGTVYRVSRSDGTVELTAALKLIRAELLDANSRDRFLRERQILATLDHPNIARLIDAGDYGDSPYYVMELVRGMPIIQYCDRNKSSISDRLDLFADVLRAVEYAHRRLVIHRDLKPDNIIVDADGKPRIVDFGIATLVGAANSEDRALSPNYAAPEQFTGATPTTACDIYSLGVVLYELLCGQRPFIRTAQDIVQQRDTAAALPQPPSATISSDGQFEVRGCSSPRVLATILRGDLDAICLRALNEDPDARYGSAADMESDLVAHRALRPVSARRITPWERVTRLVRRNRLASFASALAFVAVMAFLVSLVFHSARLAEERDLAERERGRAESALEFLVEIFRSADPGHALKENLTAREVLTNGARRVRTELSDQPELRADLTHTITDVLLTLGLYEDARQLIGSADDDGSLSEIAPVRHALLNSELLHAQSSYEPALEQVDQVLNTAAITELDRARALELKALILASSGERQQALQLRQGAYTIRERELGENHADSLRAQLEIARAMALLGNNEGALDVVNALLPTIARAYPDGHPEMAAAEKLAAILNRRLDNDAQALVHAESALASFKQIYGDEHLVVASALNSLANIERKVGEPADALNHYLESLNIYRQFLPEASPNVAMTRYNLGLLYRDFNRLEEAIDQLRTSVSSAEEIWDQYNVNANIFRLGLATALTDAGELQESEQLLLQATDAFRKSGKEKNLALAEAELGNVLLRQGRIDAGSALLARSLPILVAHFGEDDADVIRAQTALAQVQ